MKSFVYVIGDPNSDIFKIGKSNAVNIRVKDLRRGNPNLKLFRVFMFDSESAAYKAEKLIHRLVQLKQYYGEWYKLNNQDISEIEAQVKNYQGYKTTPLQVGQSLLPYFQQVKPVIA